MIDAAEITRLKKIAKRATPGPWKPHWRTGDDGLPDCGVFHESRPGQAYSVARCPRYQSQAQWEADGAHIATFDPPTVLAILDELEHARAALGETQAKITELEERAKEWKIGLDSLADENATPSALASKRRKRR